MSVMEKDCLINNIRSDIYKVHQLLMRCGFVCHTSM